MEETSHQIVSLPTFRKDCSKWVGWCRHTGGRVWVSRHGRLDAALVPMDQCERLERFESRSLAEERRRMEMAYSRWKRALADGGEADLAPFDWDAVGVDDGF